jgi:predicted PurR-regulated permease PerM
MTVPISRPPVQVPRSRESGHRRRVASLAWTRYAVWLVAGVVLIGSLKFAEHAIVPVLFAIFITLLLSPAVEWLARWRVPRVAAATLVMVALVALVAACLSATWEPARDWLETAPATMRKLETKIRPMTSFIAKVESVSTQAERMAEPKSKSNKSPTPVSLEAKGLVESSQEWVITIVSMLFLALFLLATDLANVGRNGNPDVPWGRFGQVFERVRSELGRYFVAVTFSNAMLGIATALTMFWLDMPNALLWGVIAFAFNFVPYAGSATTLLLLTIVALVSFDGVGKAVSVAGTYLVLTTLEGQVVQPVLVGRRVDISPPILLLGLWFGGWLWGVAGVALATPLLVSARVVAQELSRVEHPPEVEEPPETVRSRASEWLQRSARRYRADGSQGS